MPDGVTHALTSTVLATGAAAAAAARWYDSGSADPRLFWLAGGALLGVLLTPDLDLETGSISQRVVRHQAGRTLGAAWRLLWFPYGLAIGHRSALSHLPGLGTALRLAYLVLVPWAAWWLLARAFGLAGPPGPELAYAWLLGPGWWGVLGLAVSDLAHYIMDRCL